MSYDATDWAIPKLIPDVNAKSCLVVLAFHLNPRTGLCCPSVKKIMSEMGVKSVNTVRKSIRFLEEQDLITFSRVTNSRGEIVRTEYVLNLSNTKFDPKTADDEGHDMTEGQQVTEGHDMTEGGSHDDVGGGHMVSDVGHDVTPNKQLNKQIHNKKDNKVCDASASPDLFDEPVQKVEKPKEATKKGSRLTIEVLPDDWRKYCEEHAPDLDPEKAFEDFHDYWVGVPGAKGVKLDWFATWRNFLRGMPEWKRKNFAKATKTTGRMDTTSTEYLEIYRRGCTYDPNSEPSPTDADGFVAF